MKNATVTYEEIRRMKAADRRRDWERLAKGEITPEELHRENSFIPPEVLRQAKMVNPAESFRAAARLRLRPVKHKVF
ncbi:MAG: hypothetical protein HY360_02655 [Verrucomicrobia bacterium]|nr:hypothetical protein [Verrucomicrobiota bacterium]